MKLTGSTLRQNRQQLGLSQAKLAELCGIAQHLLSAFELEKEELPTHLLVKVSDALARTSDVAAITTRRKRYQYHNYDDTPILPERAAMASQTKGNLEYCHVLNDLWKQHTSKGERRLSALSLFSGCGGFSLGFSAAGFLMKGYLELDEDLRRIYKANFPSAKELGGDITTIAQTALLEYANRLGPVDVIIGGPPCQGFSLSGKREVNDPRNTLFKHYLRFVDVFRPKMAVLENVRLLTSMKNPTGGYVRDDITAEFKQHGYNVQYYEINAKYYGVPQHRERVLFIAVRDDMRLQPSLPNTTHGERVSLFADTASIRTFADACSDLPFIESGGRSEDQLHEAVKHPSHVINWLWDVPQGQSAHDNGDPTKRPPSGYNTTYKRQVWKEPAATVQTTFGMISGCRNVHPLATRSLTIREAARLQSFPDAYVFEGTLGAIRTGIGNAVPPLLAYQLAQHAKEEMLNLIKVSSFEVKL